MKRNWFARLHNHERSFLPMDYQDAEKKKKKTDEPENALRTQDSEESTGRRIPKKAITLLQIWRK